MRKEITMEEFKHCIWQFLSKNKEKSISLSEIKWNENFFHQGYIDSLDFYNLIMYLEKSLSIELPLSEIIADFPSTFEELHMRVNENKKNM